MIQNQRRGLCPVNPMTKYQAEHSKDWVLANGISRRFRSLATEVFFTAKVFVITPRLLDQLRSHNVFSAEITALMLKSTQNIIVPLPACSAASAWLTLPRYQQSSNLRVLTLWPGRHSDDDWPDLESGKLRQDPVPEVLQTRLKDIGLGKANLGLNMIPCVDRDEWRDQMIAIKAWVLPYLRWVGAQRKNKQQNEKGINVRQPEAEAVGDRPEKGV